MEELIMLDISKKIKYYLTMAYDLLIEFVAGFGLLTVCVWLAYAASTMLDD